METLAGFQTVPGPPCRSDSDCNVGWETCVFDFGKDAKSKANTGFGNCKHKQVFPLKELELWGLLTVFASIWMSNQGGVPGGGVVIPITMTFFKFDTKSAVAISNLSIFFSAFIRFILHGGKPHPLKKGKGSLIDYNLNVIMLPMIISGV